MRVESSSQALVRGQRGPGLSPLIQSAGAQKLEWAPSGRKREEDAAKSRVREVGRELGDGHQKGLTLILSEVGAIESSGRHHLAFISAGSL